MKIKQIPFELRWQTHGVAEQRNSEAGGRRQSNRKLGNVGPTSQRPWFCLPPKVCIVPGILGLGPEDRTRGDDREGGELMGNGDPESGHLSLLPNIHHPNSDPIQSGGVATSSPSNPNFPKSTISSHNLVRFVGHLWKGGPTKSFATVMRAEPAQTV